MYENLNKIIWLLHPLAHAIIVCLDKKESNTWREK